MIIFIGILGFELYMLYIFPVEYIVKTRITINYESVNIIRKYRINMHESESIVFQEYQYILINSSFPVRPDIPLFL